MPLTLTMKLLILVSILCIAYGDQTLENRIYGDIKNRLQILVHYIPKDVFQKIENEIQLQDGEIKADISEYADKLINNMNHVMVEYGLDPAQLPNATLDLPVTGYIKLSKGWLTDIATLYRKDEIAASYSSATRKILFDMPLQFRDFQFSYDYHTHVTLINIYGGVMGQVQNVKAHVVISFDFNEYKAHLDTFDIKDTGKITVHFTGNGLVDWLLNAMSSVVTVFLHPIILTIAQGVVKPIFNDIVNTTNKVIDVILNRNSI